MSSLSRKIAYLLVGVMAVIAIVLFARHSESKPTATQAPKVRVAVLNLTSNLPHYIAQEEKLFEKHGLAPDFVPFASSNQAVEAMVRGDIDLGIGISFIPFITVEQKEPGKLKIHNTSRMTSEHPFDRFIVKQDSPITDVKQLAGKKVGLFPGTSATNLSKDYLKKQGVDVNTIEFVQMPPQNHLPALESGAVDALFAYEPGLTLALTKGARAISPSVYAELVQENPIGVGVITSKFASEQPAAAKQAIAAVDEAIRFQDEQEAKARAIAKKVFTFEQPVADQFSLTPIFESTKINKAKVKELAEKLVTIGELQTIPNTDTIYYQP